MNALQYPILCASLCKFNTSSCLWLLYWLLVRITQAPFEQKLLDLDCDLRKKQLWFLYRISEYCTE